MKRAHYPLLLATLVLAACAPSPRSIDSGTADRPAASAQSNRTLSVVMRVEPPDMLAGAVDRSAIHKPLFTAALGGWDRNDQPFPILAQSLPQLNTDTWRVLPDGRMETVYKLRPGLTWHDGHPLTVDDFVFTRPTQLYVVESGLEQIRPEVREMDDIVAVDSLTVMIRWKRPFSEAAAPEQIIFPRHILEPALLQGDPEAFRNHAYWTHDYIGAGPYRIDRWERGAFIEATAFEGFALGTPKIQRVRLSWNNDTNVNMTRLLSGDGDIALDGSLRFEQASVLRNQWRENGAVLLSPTSLRYIQVQARPDYVNPKALLDPRGRKALIHAIDRPTLAETMLEDRTMVADTVPPPTVGYYGEIERVLTKYPYDLRRTEQLMAELGYAKGADGVYTSPTDGRFRVETRGVSSGDEERDTTIVDDYFRAGGFDSFINLLPSSTRAVDDKAKGTFPGLTLNNNTLQRGLGLTKWLTSNIGSDADNWVGGNRMGWSNAEFDRLSGEWTTSLNRAEATQKLTQMMKLLNEEMPSLPLYFNFRIIAHTAALQGPEHFTPEATHYGNIHTWSWR